MKRGKNKFTGILCIIVVCLGIVACMPKDILASNDGSYNLSEGYMGLKTAAVIRQLGLGDAIGMGGAYYGENVVTAVRVFQSGNNLEPTGIVDYDTWVKMGLKRKDWYCLGSYESPVKASEDSSRAERVEAMIERAYDYFGDDYIIGASGKPGQGVDCSGLVMQVLYAADFDLSPITPVRHASPGYEYESANIWESSKLTKVSYEERERGDIIIYCSKDGNVNHCAIYLGDDAVIEAWPDQVRVAPIINDERPNIKGVLRAF